MKKKQKTTKEYPRFNGWKFILCFVLLTFCITAWAVEPYYGFFPSKLGKQYKQLKHNIFNFIIDIPVHWTFGVSGQSPLAVISVYPNTLNTSKFSDNYETLEISIMPVENITLQEAYEYVILGMRQSHPSMKIVKQPKEKLIQNNNSLEFTFEWQSETGFFIIEWVSLVKYKDQIYSISSRSVKAMFTKNKDLYNRVINTFTPIETVQFDKQN